MGLKKIQQTLNELKNFSIEQAMEWLFEDKRVHDFIISANTNDQLFDGGIDANGNSLGVYAASTIKRKRKLGLPTDHVTLFETGQFHKSWKLFLDENHDFIISADTESAPYGYLLDKYGEDILGLTEENIGRLRELAKIVVQERVQQLIKKAA